MTRAKFDRFMLDVHIGTNRKLRRLTVPERWCHVAGVLAVAAQAPIRGRLLVGDDHATDEDYAETAGVSTAVARSTVAKLRKIGVIVHDDDHECERIHDWDDINPEPKKDPDAAERMRRYRERRKARDANTVTSVTGRNSDVVTPGREGKGSNNTLSAIADVEISSSNERPEFERATDDNKRLCRLLASLIIERDEKMRRKVSADSERWLRDMRLLLDADGRSADDVEQVIRWSQRDSFWSSNILSPGKLREQFPKLWGKVSPAQAASTVEDSAAYLARRGAAA